MQCYETEMMMTYIYNILSYAYPQLERDKAMLIDILEQTQVDNIVELLRLEHQSIQAIAQPYIQPLHRAA